MSSVAATPTRQNHSGRGGAFGFRKRKPRVVLQSENTECGLACMAMIADYHGYEVDLVSLRQRHPVSNLGTNFSHLAELAEDLHMAARALRAEIHELDDLQLPCILHWGVNHFVVLSDVTKNSVTILDPTCGERKIGSKELDNHFTGAVLELSPLNSFEKSRARKKLKITDLWSSIRGLTQSLAQIFFISLLLQVFTVLAPLYMQLVVDVVLTRNQWDLLALIALGFALLALTQAAIGFLRSMAILHLSSRLNLQMGSNLFHHLIRLPMSYFIKRHLGDIVSRFQSLHHIRRMMTTGIVSAWLDGFMAVVTLAIMFYYSAFLSVIVLCFVLGYAILRVIFFNRVKILNQEQLVAGANENSHFMETMRAMQPLKIFQKENDRQGQWLNKLTNLVNRDIRIAKWDAGFSSLNSILFGLENIIVIYLSVLLIRQSEISLGMLFAFVSFKASFTRAINGLITQAIEFKMLDIHFERISDIVFTGKEKTQRHFPAVAGEARNSNTPGARCIKGAIKVESIDFSYEGDDRRIFQNVSFSITPGETVAITGPSGCGKTTLLKCLMGLLEPTAGRILVDGVPQESIPYYRSSIAGVMQDDQLISGSIKDNITFFSDFVDWDQLHESAKIACVHDEIMRMPMQYNTLVGDLGGSLSGGQKQRIVLARAVYRRPRILFMDEATSHLDIKTETFVNRQINKLSITRILVAHRPETVRAAGRQIEMADFS